MEHAWEVKATSPMSHPSIVPKRQVGTTRDRARLNNSRRQVYCPRLASEE